MTVVVDASVALKWVLDEADSAAAVALLDEQLTAPSLWLLEAANTLWKLERRNQLTTQEARYRLRKLMEAPVSSAPFEEYLESAADLAAQMDHPVYDCLYLALALRENCDVVTADVRFHNAANRIDTARGRVRLLGAG